jgi:hypothetical protein
MDGATIRLQQRVPAGAQIVVASELRRRLAAALVAGSIGTGRWDTPMPIVSQPSAPPYAAWDQRLERSSGTVSQAAPSSATEIQEGTTTSGVGTAGSILSPRPVS